MTESGSADPSSPSPPPRAFAQGVGLLFQWIGVSLFLASFFVCCGSSLLSREHVIGTQWSRIGWHFGSENPRYSAQRALTISLAGALFLGMALAGAGLGLQAQSRRAAPMGVTITAIGALLWLVHLVFFINLLKVFPALICLLLLVTFTTLLLFALAARREMRANPPPQDIGVLPSDFVIPYSHYHHDPPEVRLARELAQRRQRLAVQQKELEMLEEKLKRNLEKRD